MSLNPTVKQTAQESRVSISHTVRIFIGSAVKICKQHLQNASVSGDFPARTEASSLGPNGDFRPQTYLWADH